MATRRSRRSLTVLALMGLAPLAGVTSTAHAATLDVCPSGCAYAQIQPAINAASNGDTISIAAGTYTGGLLVAKSVTLQGAGATQTIISGGVSGAETVVTVYSVATASLRDLTITGGNNNGSAGGISNGGTLTLANSIVSGNTVADLGGGIFNGGTVIVQNSTISGNGAYNGAGIFNAGGAVTVTNSAFSDNHAGLNGGGIANYYGGTLTVTNSTLGNNTASNGGGIFNSSGPVTLINSTVSGNGADDGGGIYNAGSPATVSNTLLARNTAGGFGPDCAGGLTDGAGGHNLLGDDDLCSGLTNGVNGDQVGTNSNPIDPKLGPLADNGGPTQTEALQPGSPAIDDVPTSSGLCPATDQRGYTRPDDGESSCDTGACESGAAAPITKTRTDLTSSPDPSVVGQQVTYTATVSPIPDGGTVGFKDGGSDISGCGAVAVDTGSGTATCQVTYSNTSTHTITATYGGDSSYATSTSDPLTQPVNKASTAISLISSQDPSTVGQTVTLTATIAVASPGAGSPSGTVEFDDNGTAIGGCGSQTVSNGQATCTTSSLSAGSHAITAAYSGDSNDVGSTSATLTQTVNKIATTTSLSSSANPSSVGQPVTYTATVSPVPDGGTVAFTDGGAAIGGCGSVTVDTTAGTATCRVTYTATGGHSIAAAYGGDGAYAGSSSNTVNQTVNKASTKTSLTSSPNPSVAGQQVTYTATVSPAPDGGTVAFQDGGTTIGGCGSQPVDSSGTATCQVTYATSGAHAITATYSGNSNYVGSTANTVTQTVKSDLTTRLTLSPNPVARGGTLTITGSVTNTGMVSETVTLGSTITAPNGASVSSSLGTVTVGAGKTVSRTMTYTVPRAAPTGTYTVTVTARDKTGSSSSTAKETVS